jgi:hypothetical protein
MCSPSAPGSGRAATGRRRRAHRAAPARRRGVLGGDQADVGADRGPAEPGPVTISTDNANPITAEMPRKQPNRSTGSAHRGEVATVAICSSRRSLAAVAVNTASK